MPQYDIDISKVYSIPQEVQIINYENKIIVIAPEYANWIVLNTLKQFRVFECLKAGHSIQTALNKYGFEECDVKYVVTQIEAKKLCTKKIHSSTEKDRNMHLYLTNKCNLECPHCYMFSGKANANELTTEEILNLISDYKNIAQGNIITLSGGEPTSHVHFDSIVKSASEMGLEVKIMTNGTQISPKRAAFLAKYVSSVQISIDGYSEKSNSPIRGDGNFEKALTAVDLFLKYGVHTAIAITPPIDCLRENFNGYVQFSQELSEKYKNMPFEIRFAEELMKGRYINPTDSFKKEYFDLVHKIQQMLYGEDYDVLLFVEALYDNVILDNCMFGNFAVASNGDVFCCARIGDLRPIANVRTSSFDKIYKKAQIAEKLSLITNLKPCKECELRFICGGGCRIEEFPELTQKTSFEGFDIDDVPPRFCNQKVKNKFYDLMIRSDRFFYSILEASK